MNNENWKDITVHLAHVRHRHGDAMFAGATEAALNAKLADYCKDWWPETMLDDGGGPMDPEEMLDTEIIEAYFDAMSDNEWVDYDTDTVTIED